MPIYEYTCTDCERVSSIWFRSFSRAKEADPRCEHCGSASLQRIMSAPGLIRSSGTPKQGTLRRADPRKTVENLSRQYDSAGIDPGDGFAEVAKRAAAGDHPETLKEAVKEARENETSSASHKDKDA